MSNLDELDNGPIEDEESYSEESEEERPKKKRKTKKKKKRGLSARDFLDVEAEEDDDEEEDDLGGEDEFYDAAEDIGGDELPPRQENSAREQYRRLFRGDENVEEIAKEMEARYRNYANDGEETEAGVEGFQQALLPTFKDPKMWAVRVKPGFERFTVTCLMQKMLNLQNTPERLQVYSVVAPDHLKGYLYIEAERDTFVKEAIKGMAHIIPWNMKLVPMGDMPDVLKSAKKSEILKRGSWARVKRGPYKGDLAQVWDHDFGRSQVTLRLLPRLDFEGIKQKNETEADAEKRGGKRKRGFRPPAKYFNADEAVAAVGGHETYQRRRDANGEMFVIFDGKKFKDGYLHKVFNISTIATDNISPSIEELTKFQTKPIEARDSDDEDERAPADRNEPLFKLPSGRQRKKITFQKGDRVRVTKGDLKNLLGVVEAVKDKEVTILPQHEELKNERLVVDAGDLQKYFSAGDHVKILTGKFENETGLIVKLEEDVAVVLGDSDSKEMKVFVSDIQECSEVSVGQSRLGNYDLHDLVQLGPQSVGVIVRVETDGFKVLDTSGIVKSVKLAEMGPKKNSRNQVSFDRYNAQINSNDVVKVVEGDFKGKQGTVLHLFRYFAFLQSKDHLENGGIFVVRTKNCLVASSKSNSMASAGSPMAAFQGGRGFTPPAPVGRGRGRGRDEWIGKKVCITKGNWKGYQGIVKDTTDINARIELHTKSKTITVPKASLAEVNAKGELIMREDGQPPATPQWDSAYPRTPMRTDSGSRTPMRMATPSWAPQTPLHDAWSTQFPQTPARTDDTDKDDDLNHYDTSIGTAVPTTPGVPQTPAVPTTPGFSSRGGYSQSISTPFTPNAPTPNIVPQTPGVPATPGAGLAFPQTPHTPHTPGIPATPGASLGHDFSSEPVEDGRSAWPSVNLYVQADDFQGGKYKGQTGIIREVVSGADGSCMVAFGNDVVYLSGNVLQRVQPEKKDAVMILQGDWKGFTGTLIGIDRHDGIVKISKNSDIRIEPLSNLAKYLAT